MIALLFKLFWVFFKIGLFTFGGGYAMIPMITEEMIAHGWMSESQILDYIAIGESTPGPFAIDMATLIGGTQAGFLGALVATLGVVLPPIIIILLMAMFFKSLGSNKYVKAVLKGIKPVIIGLIISTGLLLILKNTFISLADINAGIDIPTLAIMLILATYGFFYKKTMKKPLHPLAMMAIAAVIGIVVF